jgi:Tol biopolymer transport system component
MGSMRARSNVASIVLLALGACGRVGFDPTSTTDGGSAGDGGTDALMACSTWNAWSTPVLIPVVNSSSTDWAPSISDDDLYMIFSSNRGGNHELYATQRQSTSNNWDDPSLVAELTNQFDEEDDATLSEDLREMFFGKTRIFRTRRADLASPWGSRDVIVPDDFDLVQGAELSRDNLRLYFNAGSPSSDLYMMERATVTQALGPYVLIMPDPDPGGDTGWPTLSADELEIFVSSERGGERDIYTARRESRSLPFPTVTRVAELSAAGEAEWDPELTADGTTMYLSSTRGAAQGLDLYRATRTCADGDGD